MASEVAGLDPLHGYLKHGNLVVQMRFPYMELANRTEKFIERKMTPVVPAQPAAQPSPVVVEDPIIQLEQVPRKPVQRVPKNQEQQSAQVNEQHPYFE